MSAYRHGTEHVGIRRIDGSREWETYDRETGSRIGQPLPSRYEAQAYAEHRQATTYTATAEPTAQPVARCGRTDLHGAHVCTIAREGDGARRKTWCAGNVNLMTARDGDA